MSHKSKICNKALATHIEECHKAFTYTPLVINRHRWLDYDREEPRGLPAAVDAELREQVEPRLKEARAKIPDAEEVAAKLMGNNSSLIKDLRSEMPELEANLRAAIDGSVVRVMAENSEQLEQQVTREAAEAAGVEVSLDDPAAAIAARERRIQADLDLEAAQDAQLTPFPFWQGYELPELGIFFTEKVCYRPEGLAYGPCGKEFTVLPGDKIKESWSQSLSSEENEEQSEDITTDVETTTQQDNSTTLTQSFENTVKRDFKAGFSAEASLNAKVPFKKIPVKFGLSGDTSVDYQKLVKQAAKTSSEDKRSFMHKVVRNLKTSLSTSTSRTVTSKASSSFERTLINKNNAPHHFIERDQYCVYSVHHKRTNAQLGWSGCIDDPGQGLCRPQDFEEDHAEEIAAIRQKWQNAPVPAHLGPQPPHERRESDVHHWSQPSNFGSGSHNFVRGIQVNIPDGYAYVSGSADVEIVASNPSNGTGDITGEISSQPGAGPQNFGVRISLQNRFMRPESISFKVVYYVTTPEGQAWQNRVDVWREEQAEAEIGALRAQKEAEFEEFLLSDRLSAEFERLIFANFFGVTNIKDCCRFIGRVRSIFDFDALCYSLLPSWSHDGDKCQKSDPVNIYTAKCAHFFLPVIEGREHEAISLLISINAIPWNSYTAPQIWGYINAIRNMRDTLFDSAFDPTGWSEKTDPPLGYQLTPYDTSDEENWDTAYESSLNYELLDAHVITVPCGKRIEVRPDIC